MIRYDREKLYRITRNASDLAERATRMLRDEQALRHGLRRRGSELEAEKQRLQWMADGDAKRDLEREIVRLEASYQRDAETLQQHQATREAASEGFRELKVLETAARQYLMDRGVLFDEEGFEVDRPRVDPNWTGGWPAVGPEFVRGH